MTKIVKKKTEQPKIHAKVISIQVSVGTDDRERSFEDFEKEIKSVLDKHVKRMTIMGGYYILDGKVCLPKDYDPKTQNFKPGAGPPAWAGGEEPKHEKPTYLPKASNLDSSISQEEAKRRIENGKRRNSQEDEVEDFDWDESDIEDSDEHKEVVEKSTKAAVKKLRAGKRVVKRK